MELLLLMLAAGGGGAAAFAARKVVARRADRKSERAELEDVRSIADEDVTLLGEELSRLDAQVAGRELDEDARLDYQAALDAYEAAGRTVRKLRSAEEISLVTDTLARGRYALACVQARVAGAPVPEYRVPCFFNPQHGPSVKEVMWTPRGRGSKKVPACAQDAARIAAGERPDVRTVRVGGRDLAYWEAGAAFAPYAKGYHVASYAYAHQMQSTLNTGAAVFGMADGLGGDGGGN